MKRSLLTVVALVALAGCSLLHSPPADAATSVISWTNPSANTDNSPIVDTVGDETRIESWRIEYGTCSAPNVFGSPIGSVVRTRAVAGPLLTSATLNTQSGVKCFRVYVTNGAARESDASNVASRTIDAPTPRSPTNVTAAPSP